MASRIIGIGIALTAAIGLFLCLPAISLAAFADSVEIGRNKTAELTQQQLDSLNGKVFSDAFLTAKIIGYNPSEIAVMRAENAALRQEIAQLRALVAGNVGSAAFTDADVPSLEARVAKLENMFAGLQESLVLLLNMVSEVLVKLR